MQKFSIFYFKIEKSHSAARGSASDMFLNEFIKLCDELCFSYLKIQVVINTYPQTSNAFYLSQNANACSVIDSLLIVKKNINRGWHFFQSIMGSTNLCYASEHKTNRSENQMLYSNDGA